jgi:DNA-binding XRE family transcriptional regulator
MAQYIASYDTSTLGAYLNSPITRNILRWCEATGRRMKPLVGNSWEATIRKLSRALRDRRLMLDFSQAELAKKASVSLRRVQDLEAESPIANPSLRVLVQLADALDITAADLLSTERKRSSARKRATKSGSSRA